MNQKTFSPYQRNFHNKWSDKYKHHVMVEWDGPAFDKTERAGLLKSFGKIKPFARLPIKQDHVSIYYFDDRSVFDEVSTLIGLKEISDEEVHGSI